MVAAADVRGPVAVKGLGIAHKTEHNAVRLGLVEPADVRAAAAVLLARYPAVLVERLVPGGLVELLVGVESDPVFGPVLTLGVGGVLTELVRDVAHLLLPSDGAEIRRALLGLRCAPLLTGYRGAPPADLDRAVDVVGQVAELVLSRPEVVVAGDQPVDRHGGRGVGVRRAGDHVSESGGRQLAELAEPAGWVDAASSPLSTAASRMRLTSVSEEGAWRVRTRSLGAVLEVTLDRPPANAIDLATSRAMGEVFASFRDDRALRVAVLRTAGERFFCAGWDLKAAAAGDAVDGDYGVGGFGGIQELPGLNKPVIALVEGMAVGGGFELALSCDLIYAADTASFALPEINAGTLADAATLRLPTRMPHHIAMELLLTGRWMDAAEAHRWGLVNEVHPPAHLADRVLEVASRLAEGPPLVYAAIKEVQRESQRLTFAEAMRRIATSDFPTVAALYGSADQREGAQAFAEKRPPIWRGE